MKKLAIILCFIPWLGHSQSGESLTYDKFPDELKYVLSIACDCVQKEVVGIHPVVKNFVLSVKVLEDNAEELLLEEINSLPKNEREIALNDFENLDYSFSDNVEECIERRVSQELMDEIDEMDPDFDDIEVVKYFQEINCPGYLLLLL